MAHDNEIDSIIYYWSLDNFDEIRENGITAKCMCIVCIYIYSWNYILWVVNMWLHSATLVRLVRMVMVRWFPNEIAFFVEKIVCHQMQFGISMAKL